MDVKLRDSTTKEANISVKDGDIGILYIIQHELLQESSTNFAGVITRHPLTNEIWMKVNSNNPLKDMIKATNTAIQTSSDLKKLFDSKIQGN